MPFFFYNSCDLDQTSGNCTGTPLRTLWVRNWLKLLDMLWMYILFSFVFSLSDGLWWCAWAVSEHNNDFLFSIQKHTDCCTTLRGPFHVVNGINHTVHIWDRISLKDICPWFHFVAAESAAESTRKGPVLDATLSEWGLVENELSLSEDLLYSINWTQVEHVFICIPSISHLGAPEAAVFRPYIWMCRTVTHFISKQPVQHCKRWLQDKVYKSIDGLEYNAFVLFWKYFFKVLQSNVWLARMQTSSCSMLNGFMDIRHTVVKHLGCIV